MTVRVTSNGPVRTVEIDRPERRNAVDLATAILLREAFKEFDADDRAQVAVLCGSEGTFCAGFDLTAVVEGQRLHDANGPGPMGPTRMLLSKPVIAAVEGHAVAGGLELALWCDLRVASETAIFGVFCRRWGVPLIDGGTVRLPRLIGQSRALDMILTGRPVTAAEALSFGLANRVVPAGQARAAAEDLAAQVSRFPDICMRTDRLSAIRQWSLDFPEALKMEAEEGERPLASAHIGAARFVSGKGRGDVA